MSSAKEESAPATAAAAAPKMHYYAKAQSTFKPALIAGNNAFLQDIYSRYIYI